MRSMGGPLRAQRLCLQGSLTGRLVPREARKFEIALSDVLQKGVIGVRKLSALLKKRNF